MDMEILKAIYELAISNIVWVGLDYHKWNVVCIRIYTDAFARLVSVV